MSENPMAKVFAEMTVLPQPVDVEALRKQLLSKNSTIDKLEDERDTLISALKELARPTHSVQSPSPPCNCGECLVKKQLRAIVAGISEHMANNYRDELISVLRECVVALEECGIYSSIVQSDALRHAKSTLERYGEK